MTAGPRNLLKGALVVATRDFAANVRSVKLIVLSVVVLLAIIAAAFGLSGLSPTGPGVMNEYSLWTFAVFPGGPNATLGDALVRVTDYAGAAHAGLTVELGNPYTGTGGFKLRESKATDAQGWVRFGNLSQGLWPVQITVGLSTLSSGVTIYPSLAGNFTASLRQFDVLNDGANRDVSVEAIKADGTPLVGEPVLVNGTPRGSLGPEGFFHIRLDPGDYMFSMTYASESWSSPVTVRTPTVSQPIQLGPDWVLYLVAFTLMGLFGPIVAIALSYDAISKERLQGSLELLLVRPATPAGLAVGKFLGTFLSVGGPMILVALGGLAGVAGVTGKWPDALFTLAFVLGTLGLVALYILIMQIFSTVARSSGTAIMSAILVWLVFGFLWNLVFVLIQAALGIQGGTPQAFTLSSITLLFNPTGVYQLTLSAAFPPTLAASAGSAELPNWSGPVAFVIWIAILLVIAVVAFRRKIV